MHTLTLSQYLADRPRGTATRLAAELDISRVYLAQLAARQDGREPSPELCVAIERVTDRQVRRWNLRPTDWHLIWPELIGIEGAPAVPVAEAEVRDAA